MLGRPYFATVAPPANAEIPRKIMDLAGQGGERWGAAPKRTERTELTVSMVLAALRLRI